LKEVNLIISEECHKKAFFDFLKDTAKIPICKKCGRLFGLGFPRSEDGIADRLICEENYLLCECENLIKVRELFSIEKDGELDISEFYEEAHKS